jgi:hypothetical protein
VEWWERRRQESLGKVQFLRHMATTADGVAARGADGFWLQETPLRPRILRRTVSHHTSHYGWTR